MEPAAPWERIDEGTRKAALDFGADYRRFISCAKTERECAELALSLAQNAGFVPLKECRRVQPGDRVYELWRGKCLALAVVGGGPLERGLNVIGAHIDSPRLDLKPRPLYEEAGLALFKTQYYGGIKKYHWVGIPLALHGVAVRGDGQVVRLVIGEEEGDPVFTITDLLPHLAREQMEKKMSEAIKGEDLNVLVGGLPASGEAKEKVKRAVLDYLRKEHGLAEEDLVCAEIEAVPAWPARDVGFDRSMIGAYGQDDRVCAYAALRALLDAPLPLRRTAVVLLVDKEEIGSTGNTGMYSAFFTNFVAELAARAQPGCGELALRRILAASRALSADVNAGLDPGYPEVMDKINAARLGHGVVLTRYTGAAGKKGASEAHAEYVAFVRRLFEEHGVIWQSGLLGKVDQGGGGTIAYLLAMHGMDVLDCGVPVLGMHSPFEVAHKLDVYMAYRGYGAFLQAD